MYRARNKRLSGCSGQPDFVLDNQILKTGCPCGQRKYFLVKYAQIFDQNASMEHWLDRCIRRNTHEHDRDIPRMPGLRDQG
jgi:hypothetical protein